MLWYEIILSLLAIVSLLFIVWKYVSKFPLAARVDLGELPEEKQQSVKQVMLERRLQRKVRERLRKVKVIVSPWWKMLKNIAYNIYQALLEYERNVRAKRLQAKSAVEVGNNSLQQRVELLLSEAEEEMKKDNLLEAEKKLIEVVTLDPKNVKAFAGLGEIYINQRKYKEARETFLYLLKISGADADFYDKLGQIAQAEGKLQEAESHYLKSVDINSQNANFLYHLAEVYQLEGEYDKAVVYLKKTLSLEPNNPRYLDSLLKVSIIRKDKITAKEIFDKLKEVNSENKKLSEFREQIDNL